MTSKAVKRQGRYIASQKEAQVSFKEAIATLSGHRRAKTRFLASLLSYTSLLGPQ
jgi:hypothetical protein